MDVSVKLNCPPEQMVSLSAMYFALGFWKTVMKLSLISGAEEPIALVAISETE